jgi:hypothetical protein
MPYKSRYSPAEGVYRYFAHPKNGRPCRLIFTRINQKGWWFEEQVAHTDAAGVKTKRWETVNLDQELLMWIVTEMLMEQGFKPLEVELFT